MEPPVSSSFPIERFPIDLLASHPYFDFAVHAQVVNWVPTIEIEKKLALDGESPQFNFNGCTCIIEEVTREKSTGLMQFRVYVHDPELGEEQVEGGCHILLSTSTTSPQSRHTVKCGRFNCGRSKVFQVGSG